MLELVSLPADGWWELNGDKPRSPQFGVPVAWILAQATGESCLLRVSGPDVAAR